MSDPSSSSLQATESPPFAVASLVLGIISIAVIIIPLLGLPPGILAIVFAVKGGKRVEAEPQRYKSGGIRIAGLVCGIIGTSLAGFYAAWWIIVAVFFAQSMTVINNAIQSMPK